MATGVGASYPALAARHEKVHGLREVPEAEAGESVDVRARRLAGRRKRGPVVSRKPFPTIGCARRERIGLRVCEPFQCGSMTEIPVHDVRVAWGFDMLRARRPAVYQVLWHVEFALERRWIRRRSTWKRRWIRG